MKGFIDNKFRVFLSCVLLIGLGSLLYSPILSFEYVWDDTLLFVDKVSLLNEPLSWELVSQPVLFGTSYFRPLVFLSWYVEFKLWGQSSAVSHAIHLFVYLLNCLLVYGIARIFLQSCERRELKSLLAASVYCAHPVLIETTAWVSGRFDLFVSFFMYFAVLVYFSGGVKGKIALVGLLYICALFSKELGLVFPFVLYALWMARFGTGNSLLTNTRRFVRENMSLLALLFIISLAYLVLRSYSVGGIYHRGISWFYVTEAYFSDFLPFKALLFYVYRLVLPFLSGGALHPYEYYWTGIYESVLAIAFALMAFIVVVRGLVKNERPVYWLILAGLFCLSLVLHIIPITIGENLGHDRFLSSGLAFFVIGAMYPNYVGLLKRIKVRQKVSIGIVSGCVVFWFGMVALTHHSFLNVWKDEFSLWQESYRVYPSFKPGSYNYVYSALKSGRLEIAEKVLLEIAENEGFGISEQSLYADLLVRKGDPEALRYLEGLEVALPKFHNGELPMYMITNFQVTPKQLGGFYSTYASALIVFENDLEKAKEYNKIAAWYLEGGEMLPLLYQRAAVDYLLGKYNDSFQQLVVISRWNFAHKENLVAFFETLVEKYCKNKKSEEACDMYLQRGDQWTRIESELHRGLL